MSDIVLVVAVLALAYSVYVLSKPESRQKPFKWTGLLFFITAAVYAVHATIEAFDFGDFFYFLTGFIATTFVFLVIISIFFTVKELKEKQ